MKLQKNYLEKPWGRTEFPAPFEGGTGSRIGEIVYAHPDGMQLPLLIKLIFTSAKLSVQVHPDDRLGRVRGYPHGKTECWYILDAEPEAAIALGFKSDVDAATVKASALDGCIEEMLQWLPVKSGDFFYVPAGTVHAIGGGITVLEVQQNLDVTYRLFDYGRPRELHLADAIEAAKLQKYDRKHAKQARDEGKQVLVRGEHFSVLKVEGPKPPRAEATNVVVANGVDLPPNNFAARRN